MFEALVYRPMSRFGVLFVCVVHVVGEVEVCPYFHASEDLSQWVDTIFSTVDNPCDWTLLVGMSVYVNVPAIARRLECGFPVDDVPMALARMSGRLSQFFVHWGKNGALFFSLVKTGLLLNRAAINVLLAYAVGVRNTPDVFRVDSQLLSQVDQSGAVDGVQFSPIDVGMTIFLYRNAKLRISNWASYLEHYVVGADEETVVRKLRIRSAVGACVLAAYPVGEVALGILHSMNTTTCGPDRHTMDTQEYSWINKDGVYESEPYYSPRVLKILKNCTSHEKHVTFENVLCENASCVVRGHVILSPPGGGSTWLFHVLSRHAHVNAAPDIFHPYVNEVYRAELSHCFAAAEDETRTNLVLPTCNLTRFIVSTITNGEPFFTKEVMNIFRILQLGEEEENVNILLLYRSRFSTFPTVGDDTCRMCFFAAFYESFMTQNHSEQWLNTATNFLRQYDANSVEAAVLIHTVLWRYILSRIRSPQILNYDDLINANSENQIYTIMSQNWDIDNQVDIRAASSDIFNSRKTSKWLQDRHFQYQELHVESKVNELLSILGQVDPFTNSTLLYAY